MSKITNFFNALGEIAEGINANKRALSVFAGLGAAIFYGINPDGMAFQICAGITAYLAGAGFHKSDAEVKVQKQVR